MNKEIFYNKKEINDIILKNWLKMLTNRGIFDNNNMGTNYELLKSQTNDKLEYTLKGLDNKNHSLKLFLTKISTTSNFSGGLDDFLKLNHHKVIVINKTSLRVYKSIIDMGDIEIFFDYELMIDLISQSLVPKHEILTEIEEKAYLNSYQSKDTLRRILTMDPVARYYRMKEGNIIRVIRPSLATGYSISYLVVMNGLHSHPILKNS